VYIYHIYIYISSKCIILDPFGGKASKDVPLLEETIL